ncbi:MAG: sn-glycerol-3-phosphate ABC transporter ATP-binding protein UgpC [Gammaproteobacteria bacterium]|nr:sn-glycerol-3-phosphate ABC transporter ATP-binding protein UgpC [Gammaproteobacteria bacterium]MBU1440153.1 sn-glycerol-3-phosphate ABC transporter ATP-binding protein UgpC [Gammaproteobacteria bacterium]MBU2288659.1 sn-glycerol-3-phosphate ABC transporter ATP-binding protein UgpC [Gammaproteobacteria bacterium]
MAAVELKGVRKRFDRQEAIRGVDLSIASGEFCVFVGPSGCGKSTLLRIVAGLEDVSDGQVLIGGVDVTDKAPRERGIAMVFQSYALYPHMTVHDNIAFGLETGRKLSRDEIDRKVRDAAETLALTPLLDRLPRQLSGGQRQRVAIGRAIVRQPEVFLFDEPLSNLDATLRVQMRIEIAKLHREMQTTMIYVTHDQVEAMTLADKIVVLNAGRIEQVGSPVELYERPRNTFVAGFIGSSRMNFLDCRAAEVSADGVTVVLPGDVTLKVPAARAEVAVGDEVTLGFRPEHVELEAGDALLEAPVEVIEELGDGHLMYLRAADGTLVNGRFAGAARLHHGEMGRFFLVGERCHLFDKEGRALTRVGS